MQGLTQQLVDGCISRREFTRRAIVLGVSASVIGSVLAAQGATAHPASASAPASATLAREKVTFRVLVPSNGGVTDYKTNTSLPIGGRPDPDRGGEPGSPEGSRHQSLVTRRLWALGRGAAIILLVLLASSRCSPFLTDPVQNRRVQGVEQLGGSGAEGKPICDHDTRSVDS
jgi:hypothetical protein